MNFQVFFLYNSLYFIRYLLKYFKMPEGVEEVPTIGIIYPPPEVRSILFKTLLRQFN